MSRKSKGINAERDIVNMFRGHGIVAIRVAGSGSTKYDSADIIAGNKNVKLAIECKTCADDKKYLSNDSINQIRNFSESFGAAPILAVKFDRGKWGFFILDRIKTTEAGFVISKEDTGMSFEDLLELIKS